MDQVTDNKLDQLAQELAADVKSGKISRRDMLKMAGVGGAALMMAGQEAQAATAAHAGNAKGKIVIVGGGFAGLSIANKLDSMLSSPDMTIIEPSETVMYQPGYTLIASGVYDKDDVVFSTGDYIPSGAKWVKEKVAEFYPDENYVKTSGGQKIDYDYLVIATGLQINFDGIEGMSQEQVGKDGVGCIYTHEGAAKTLGVIKEFCEKGGEGIFTHPNTPVKCGGAPKKIQFLTDGYARKIGTRDKINTTFMPNGGAMFGVKEYHEAIVGFYKERDMKWKYKHNLVSIDPGSKKAHFDHTYEVKGAFDEILGEHEMIKKTDRVTVDYDFIHVVPPMSAPDAVKASSLAWQKGSAAKGGWVELEKETLRHTRYPNVFGCGDVAGIPMGKTGGSVRKQYVVMCQNLVDVMEGKEPSAKYGGYTVCPLITGYGTVALLEFDWTKKPTPSFPLDPSVDRWIYWMLKVYMLKPMTMYGMLKGRA